MNERTAWKHVHPNDLTKDEKIKAMEILIFISKIRHGTIKGLIQANGSTHRSFISKEEASIPTIANESVLITSVVEANQKRYII